MSLIFQSFNYAYPENFTPDYTKYRYLAIAELDRRIILFTDLDGKQHQLQQQFASVDDAIAWWGRGRELCYRSGNLAILRYDRLPPCVHSPRDLQCSYLCVKNYECQWLWEE